QPATISEYPLCCSGVGFLLNSVKIMHFVTVYYQQRLPIETCQLVFFNAGDRGPDTLSAAMAA
ncbi:MAG TPA: hypothetical protein VIS54_07170, partial [Psychromonas sp.]